MRRNRRYAVLGAAATALALGISGTRAETIRDAAPAGFPRITVSERIAVVRESFTADLAPGENTLRFPGIPAEAEPSSLTLIDPARVLRLETWHTPSFTSRGDLNVRPAGRGIRLERSPGEAVAREALEAVITAAAAGTRRFDLVYALTGMSWRATYDVLLRGDLEDVGSPLAMDVDGWIEISNRSGRVYADAAVTVIGPDTLGIPAEAIKEPGILDLDEDSPLADLWIDPTPEVRHANTYPVKGRYTIPAADAVMLSHVSVKRKPVNRLLLVRAEEIPTDTFMRYANPSQFVTFRNEADYGGDRAVPPGAALIHVGGQRATLYQKAWFKHTAAREEIRMDMGKIEGVRVRRLNRGRIDLLAGRFEQTFELRAENLLNQKVSVVIDEEPQVFNLQWSLMRVNQPYELVGRRLVFHPEIEPGGEVVIQYVVRYSLPER